MSTRMARALTASSAPATNETGALAGIQSDIALEHVLVLVRWGTIVGLLLLSIVQPLSGRTGLPTWTLILAFAGYSAVVTLLRRPLVWLRPYARIAALDLAVVVALYALAASPGGPVFALFLLLTVCVSCTMRWPRSLLYTGAVLVILVVVSPTLPRWSHDGLAVRNLITRLIVVVLANVGTILLVHLLNNERRAALAASYAAAQQAEFHRLRDVFIASVSHELRTPLTALQAGLGMLDLSLHDRMRADERHMLGTARRNSERLRLLVDDLLTFNQLEVGAFRIERDRIDLADVVASAVAAVRPLLLENNHSVKLEMADSLPYLGDGQRLEQALINLLANVCEHTPAGTSIAITSASTAEEVLLTVTDDGPGIPLEERERVFHPFHQIAPTHHGSGLGLTIARRIVELHDGRLSVQGGRDGTGVGTSVDRSVDTDTQGTTFCIALPLRLEGE
ncbi:MAG: sensor histidine kinase [Nitrososphaerota archaeon]